MNVKKRGLGRGLEVLLADSTSPTLQSNPEANANHQLAEQLFEEQLNLLQEAENLKQLLDELAQMLRGNQH